MSERRRNPFAKSRCQVCASKDRTLIERSRLAGVSLDAVSERYGVSRDSVYRHCRDHIDDALRASLIAEIPLRELAERASAEGLSLLDYLALIRGTLTNEFQLAASLHDRNGTAILAGRLLETVRQMAQLTGELTRLAPNTVNIGSINFIGSPAFLALHEMLLRKLAGYPEALAAVLAGLGELEAMAAADAAKPVPPMIEHAGAVA